MNRNLMFTLAIAGFAVAACESGDINIAPATTVTDSNNTTNNAPSGPGFTDDDCAAINVGGNSVRGSADATTGDCTYPDIVGAGNNLQTDLFIPALPNGGAHIFEGSLFVGDTCNTDACLAANGITQGGDGPTLTIEAGATLAWRTNSDFLVVNRGSRIIARGEPDAPITFTSVSDVNGTVGPEDVQQWGGMVINGFGVTNDCDYTGTRGQAGFALNGECHVDSEGSAGLDENQHGGDNDADNSGELSYVVVKHTGATVGNGDELNGITFAAVGSGTIVNNLQVYSTFDDGIEMFGGSFDIENFIALYVRDDSIDLDAGWQGTIRNALVVQSETIGNHCIESDGLAGYGSLGAGVADDFIARNLNTRATINNLTCIISPTPTQGDFDPGAGWRFREGIWFNLNDSMVITSFAANNQDALNDNYCLRVDDPETEAGATNGDSNLNSVIYACQETFRDTAEETFANGEGNVSATIPNNTAVSATAVNDADLQLLEGTVPVFSIDFATSLVDGAAPNASATPTTGTFLGALSLGGTDWTQPWSFGIDPSNRGQALWFETL
ncbi:MAG: serine/threonine protein kinase [Pseudomonadota bacterium]